MAASPGDLTTLDKVKRYLEVEGPQATSIEPFLEELIARESDWFRTQTGRSVLKAADVPEIRDGTGSSRIIPLEYPVLSVASVKVDGVTVPPSVGGAAGWIHSGPAIVLVSYWFTRGTANVELVYRAGYDPVPGDLEQAVIERVALTFEDRKRVGVAYKVVAGETMDFRGGAQLPRVMDMVERYRRRNVG
jgi:hypothetical protein